MIRPIPEDAEEVIYCPPYGRPHYLVKVAKHTPTTVQIDGHSNKFRRKDGFQQGDSLASGTISPVTPEGLDRIEASKLYPQVEALQREIRHAAANQLNRRINATITGRPSDKTADCKETIEALKKLLDEYTSML